MKKCKLIKFMSLTLAIAIVGGSVIGYNKMKSSANEVNESVSSDAQVDNTKAIENAKEFEKKISDIKSKYNIEETITTLEDLKNTLKSEQNLTEERQEEIIAATTKEVIIQFINDEYNNCINNADETVEEVESVINGSDTTDENVKITNYTNGDFETEKVITNEYGVTTTICISDKADNVTRAGYKEMHRSNGANQVVGYGDRTHTFTYKMNILWIFDYTLRYKVNYSVSSSGLKLKNISDAGTIAHWPFAVATFEKPSYDDRSATHVGANIDGTAWARFEVLPGAEFSGIKFPSGSIIRFYSNFWITIKSMNSGSITLTHNYSVYGDAALFSN